MATAYTFFAPGRVNLIGEHIDYNGGMVFPAALTLGITLTVIPDGSKMITFSSANAVGEHVINLASPLPYDESRGWANYPTGVAAYLQDEGFNIPGGTYHYESNLPDGTGLSSSAAIEVVTAYAMLTLGGKTDIDLSWLARFCQLVENRYIRVNSGIMDQFAVANCREGHALLLNCNTLDYEHVPADLGEYSLLIMNTNKRRELAESKYNERRRECDFSLEILNRRHNFKDLCNATLEAVESSIKDPILMRRSRHVITENQRVYKAVDALKAGDLATFGQLLNDSHTSLSDDYEVTGPELDAIVTAAQAEPACLGARMTGAGFGGCAIALVKTSELETFKANVAEAYTDAIGLTPIFYISQNGPGVHLR